MDQEETALLRKQISDAFVAPLQPRAHQVDCLVVVEMYLRGMSAEADGDLADQLYGPSSSVSESALGKR